MEKGDKLKVTGNVTNHGFQIGEIVTVVEIVEDKTSIPICKGINGNIYGLHNTEYTLFWEV